MRIFYSVIGLLVLVLVSLVSYEAGRLHKQKLSPVIKPILVNGETTSLKAEMIGEELFIRLQDFKQYSGAVDDESVLNPEEPAIQLQIPDTRARKEGASFELDSFLITDLITEQLDQEWSIAAEIRNTSNQAYETVQLTAVYENRSGLRIGTATGMVYDLLPDHRKTIQLVTLDNLADYDSVRFQTDFIY